ncbi:MAG: hypothetical protein ACRBN8_44935 [Nannocystales bacterium]
MPVEIEDSAWPVATLRIRGAISSEEEDRFIEASERFPDRGERYVAVVDLLEAKAPSGRFIRGQAAAMGKRGAGQGACCVGMAFAVDSAMLRGALQAVFHFQRPSSPYVVVRDVQEARRWAESMLLAVLPKDKNENREGPQVCPGCGWIGRGCRPHAPHVSESRALMAEHRSSGRKDERQW